MRDDLEDMLRNALIPSERPEPWLDQSIIRSAGEREESASHSINCGMQKAQRPASEQEGCPLHFMEEQTDDQIESRMGRKLKKKIERKIDMRKEWLKRVPAAIALLAALTVTGSLSAYAAWRYLRPEQAAERLEDQKLRKAFEGEDAVYVNESQSDGGYNVTLLGMVSGDDLSEFPIRSGDDILSDRTYIVAAVEKESGDPLSNMDDPFMVSPFIQGEDPRIINIFTMNGGRSSFVEDGVMYMVVDCDDLLAFAGRGVYLGVIGSVPPQEDSSDRSGDSFTLGMGSIQDAYGYDEATGEVTRNEDYEGLNALFRLPLDPSQADEEEADRWLEQWIGARDGTSDDEQEEETGEDGQESPGKNEGKGSADGKKDKKWTIKRLHREAEIIPETVKTRKPDEKGYVHYYYKYQGIQGKEQFLAEAYSDQPDEFILGGTEIDGGKELIEVCTRNSDGTYTMACYRER